MVVHRSPPILSLTLPALEGSLVGRSHSWRRGVPAQRGRTYRGRPSCSRWRSLVGTAMATAAEVAVMVEAMVTAAVTAVGVAGGVAAAATAAGLAAAAVGVQPAGQK